MIASPHQASDAHLDVLARLSTLLVSDEFRENLLNAKSVDEFLNLINQADSREIKKEKQQIKKEEDLAQESSRILFLDTTMKGLSTILSLNIIFI